MSLVLRRSLATACVPSTSRHFSSSLRRLASPSDDLSFPSKANPSPWELFHFSPSATPTPAELKARYHELAKRFHPDSSTVNSNGKSRDTSSEFKQIVAAYEILKSPSRRATYLRSRPSAHGGADPWAAYDFTRGRPMSSSRRPTPSADHWNWAADPQNPHFRPSYSMGNATGWAAEGSVATNGTVILALVGLIMVSTPLSIWWAVPPELTRSSLANATMSEAELERIRSGTVGGSLKKHEDAARSLERARREARVGGKAKMQAIRENQREVERRRAYERALEVERIERAESGTGHLLLPTPAVASHPSPASQ